MQNSAEARYDRLSEEFFGLYYTYHPPHATRQGLHQYDHHLGHYRRDEIEETLRRMKVVRAQVVDDLGVPDRGVRQAGFRVLVGAYMPAVLVECSFLSHKQEEQRLRDPEYRQQVADAIHIGIANCGSRRRMMTAAR